MALDVDGFFENLSSTVRACQSFLVALPQIIQWCAKTLPHKDWEKVAKFVQRERRGIR
jgi:hypothetical protein